MQNSSWINGYLTAEPEEFVLGNTRFLYFTVETDDGEELEIITAGTPVIYLKDVAVGNFINVAVKKSCIESYKLFATCVIPVPN